MVEHQLDDYDRVSATHVVARCTCHWRSTEIPAVGDLLDDEAHHQVTGAWHEHIDPLITAPPSQLLERRTGADSPDAGWRDYLAGEPVHHGEPLELCMPGGVWIRGRYESRSGPDGAVPVFYTTLGGPAADNGVVDYVQQVSFDLPPRALLRRPERRR